MRKRKPIEPPSKDWCIKMAHLEEEIGVDVVAGVPDEARKFLDSREPMLMNSNARDALLGEADPLGKAQHEPGAKLDKGKIRASLVLGDFSRALEAVCEVGTDGAEKYTDHGWLGVPDGFERYSDAMQRHWLAEGQNQMHDDDSGHLHAAHVAWNALARLELLLRERHDEQ